MFHVSHSFLETRAGNEILHAIHASRTNVRLRREYSRYYKRYIDEEWQFLFSYRAQNYFICEKKLSSKEHFFWTLRCNRLKLLTFTQIMIKSSFCYEYILVFRLGRYLKSLLEIDLFDYLRIIYFYKNRIVRTRNSPQDSCTWIISSWEDQIVKILSKFKNNKKIQDFEMREIERISCSDVPYYYW